MVKVIQTGIENVESLIPSLSEIILYVSECTPSLKDLFTKSCQLGFSPLNMTRRDKMGMNIIRQTSLKSKPNSVQTY